VFQHQHAGPPNGAGASAKKGYYPDPTDPSIERWWDGGQWTGLTRTPKAAREPLWRSQVVALVVTAGALVIIAVGLAPLVRSGASAFGAEAYESPVTIERDLDAGRYTVFELTGSQFGGGGVNAGFNTFPTLGPGDVQVTGPDGGAVSVTVGGSVQTIQRGRSVYTGAVDFTVHDPGRYSVRVGGPPDRVLLTRTLFDGASGSVPLLIGGAVIGGVAMTTFMVMVIVRAKRRRTA
jgi:hypothetical protein